MSDMKCPFCQQELKYEKTTGIYCCPRTFIDCPLGLGTGAFGTKELWQALDRTKKQLERAKESLLWYDDNYDSVVARNTLDEIKTALEQKE